MMLVDNEKATLIFNPPVDVQDVLVVLVALRFDVLMM
jgi:hypothetical protein